MVFVFGGGGGVGDASVSVVNTKVSYKSVYSSNLSRFSLV